MRYYSLLCLSVVLFFVSCNNNESQTELQAKTDSLQTEIDFIKKNYKPGLGELMLSIQQHYNRLWVAGIKKNWELSRFEADEIKELLENATALHPTHEKLKMPLSEAISLTIQPALDSLNLTIASKSKDDFVNAFDKLTISCNKCHQANSMEFMVIERPGIPAFSGEIE